MLIVYKLRINIFFEFENSIPDLIFEIHGKHNPFRGVSRTPAVSTMDFFVL